MKALIATLAVATALATANAALAHSSSHKHHYRDGSYQYTCVNEESYCGNWNTGKPN